MADRPILFSGPMIRALLDGRKTQTRRALRVQPPREEDFRGSSFGMSQCVADGIKMYSQNQYEQLPKHPTDWEVIGSVGVARDAGFPKRYRVHYVVGDRLWVRETFRGARGYDDLPPSKWGNKPIWYEADGLPVGDAWWFLSAKRKPGIHMPRWASRITLTVTDVRVQRLWDISTQDALAEGALEATDVPYIGCMGVDQARDAFALLWDSINGDDAWDQNPWVAALTFTVEQTNINQLAA